MLKTIPTGIVRKTVCTNHTNKANVFFSTKNYVNCLYLVNALIERTYFSNNRVFLCRQRVCERSRDKQVNTARLTLSGKLLGQVDGRKPLRRSCHLECRMLLY